MDGSDLKTKDLVENLPKYEEAYDVYYTNETFNQTTFSNYSQAVYDFAMENVTSEPYSYGSYEIFQANRENQTYKFINYVNLTSRDSV